MPTILLCSAPYSQRPHLVLLLWASFKDNCQEDRTATLNQTNKSLSIQSGTMGRRKCRKAHIDWNNIQWYSSTTLSQLPAQGEDAVLLNFIISIWFYPHLILLPFMCPDSFWTYVNFEPPQCSLSRNFSAELFSKQRNPLFFLLPAWCIWYLPSHTVTITEREKYLWYLFSICGGRTKKKIRQILPYATTVLEEKDNEGWCSPNNLKK